MHCVNVDYCGCRPVSKVRQLLRRGLYPSSQDNPRTCTTFSLLNHMQMLSLTSKCSTYDYYKAIEKLTNNTGINLPRSKYQPLLRILLQWRHLKMLKRAGRGHDVSGVSGTKDGDLAIACPSCPHPGINLPVNWQEASPTESYLYTPILCMDANFRLKNQLVSNYSVDPGLGRGWSYTVPREPFEAYVQSRVGDIDIADDGEKGCGLQAVDQANTKYNKGLRYTGATAVSCGRSEMVMPCSVCNLHKGEKFANMDFGLASTLRFLTALLFIVLSYDAACIWFVNFAKRVRNYWLDNLKPPPHQSFSPAIPKLHEEGHKKTKNHEQFSFNLHPGVGHTDGEGPERIWSAHNALGNATKTMGPGSRHNVLDDHFGYWNYGKYVAMGKSLMRRYQKALPERNKQKEAHRGFTAPLDAKDVSAWKTMCEKWEADTFLKSVKNPYHVESSNITQAQVLAELAEEEKLYAARGGVTLHEVTPSAFLTKGIALEDSQRRLAWLVAHKEKDASEINEQRSQLRKDIEMWRRLQAVYMPGLPQYLNDQEHLKAGSTLDGHDAESLHLWLPSSISTSARNIVCLRGLPCMEDRLRTAQCSDALDSICDTLQLKSRMVLFKNKNIRGQREGTRSRTIINRVHGRARKYAGQYRAARAAKLALVGPGEWEKAFQVLRDSDIRSYQDPERVRRKKRRRGTWEDSEKRPEGEDVEEDKEDDGEGIDLLPENRSKRDGTGRTRLTISWIWTVKTHDTASSERKVDDILRSEWCRSRARVEHAVEEVLLVREEMRRVLAFLEWKASWWTSKQEARPVCDAVLTEGLRAYASDQACRQLSLRTSFCSNWRKPLDGEDISDEDDSDEEVSSEEEEGEAMDVDIEV
ncbi:hypothetical protein CVT26_008661 [Gymnopilus dilepis]|uniref:CxC2-like cysteine cluster KDZ transposase-associated domain-containing protein n=1 Tax=Gymnopilus dilepis TaxID=231916 RepID=A0A409YRW9_9AGAR|nr:hypothetical protein CVT26_008661 [Gymnopilus dilepis]